MCRFLLPRAFLAVGILACLTVTAPAADLDKYLPDDAQMVAVVNVKQITSWTPFQKQLKDQVEQLLKADAVQMVLKDTGFDPLRDVDRVILMSAADSYKEAVHPPMVAPPVPAPVKPPPAGAAPGLAVPPPPPPIAPPPTSTTIVGGSPLGFVSFALVQGKFDADKLQAKAEQAAKDNPGLLKSRKVGGIELWEVGGPGPDHAYVAMLDKGTLMVTTLDSQATEAIDKAAGKRKTELKDKAVRDALAKLDPKAALQMTASGDMVTSVKIEVKGAGPAATSTQTMRDNGVEGLHAAVTLGDADLHYEVSITAKDADKAKDMAKQANDGLEMGLKNVTNAAQQMKELQPLVDAMKAVKITTSGDVVSIEGSATPDAVEGAVKALFMVRPGTPPGPVPPPTVTGGPPAPPKKD